MASALPQGTFSSWERGVFRDAIAQYQEIAEKIINSDVSEKPLKLTTQHHQLQLLQMLWDNLNQELELVKTKLAD